MENFGNFGPGPATAATLAIVFLLLIYWVRRPERRGDLTAPAAEQAG
ncbi:MAG: hypothetical protein GY717_04990 [Rhodobacteraceae bacterium]|nr:hypothetical protein [Paracoccaceae bacterium]